MFKAAYINGRLNNIRALPNLRSDRAFGQDPIPGELNFDAEIHLNGTDLYYVEGIFSGNSFPVEANIALASQTGDTLFFQGEGRIGLKLSVSKLSI